MKAFDRMIPCIHCGTQRRIVGENESEKEFYLRAREAKCGNPDCGRKIGVKQGKVS